MLKEKLFIPNWALEKLPKRIIYVKHPIETGNGDWAIGMLKSQTLLYSRYSFRGTDGLNKQRIFKWRGRLDKFEQTDWGRFIRAVGRWVRREVPQEAAALIGDLSRLRARWIR
jgi:hypothetical protein